MRRFVRHTHHEHNQRPNLKARYLNYRIYYALMFLIQPIFINRFTMHWNSWLLRYILKVSFSWRRRSIIETQKINSKPCYIIIHPTMDYGTNFYFRSAQNKPNHLRVNFFYLDLLVGSCFNCIRVTFIHDRVYKSMLSTHAVE